MTNHSLFHKQLIEYRHFLHQHAELAFEEQETSQFIHKKLIDFGFKVEIFAKTGLVATLKNGNGSRNIAIRAEIDALPIVEKNKVSYKSKNKGVMHACGHDGHAAMALGAAQQLAHSKNFNGTVYFIFQPAEETGLGALQMIENGLFKTYPIQRIFTIHNASDIAAHTFSINANYVLATQTWFEIQIVGQKSHAAYPPKVSAIKAGGEVIGRLQTITDQIKIKEKAVFAITQVQSGNSMNVIPAELVIKGGFRCFSNEYKKALHKQMELIMKQMQKKTGIKYKIVLIDKSPVVRNSPKERNVARKVAREMVGENRLRTTDQPVFPSDDFAYYLQHIPGCYIALGTGSKHQVHTAHFDFNDDVLMTGTKYWVKLVEEVLRKR